MLQCPVCGSTDLRRVEAEQWRCNTCDSLLDRSGDQLVVRVRGVAPKGPGWRWPTWRPAMLLVLLLAVGLLCAGLWWALSTPARPEMPPDVHGPDIDLRDQQAGTTPGGDLFWLQTYRNLDRQPIVRPTMHAKLFDEAGKVVADFRGAAVESRLAPGAETVILVVAPSPPPHARVEVLADPPVLDDVDPDAVTLGTRGLRVEGDQISGVLTNLGDTPARVDTIAVVGRRNDGTPVAYATGVPQQDTLKPGQRTTFTASATEYRTGTPDIWTAAASGVRTD